MTAPGPGTTQLSGERDRTSVDFHPWPGRFDFMVAEKYRRVPRAFPDLFCRSPRIRKQSTTWQIRSRSIDSAAFGVDGRARHCAREFVGHSMGGLIAARLAAEAPDRVDKLVLVDAAFLGFDSGVFKRGIGLVDALRQVPHDFLPLIARDSLRAHPFSLFAATLQLLRSDWSHILSAIEAPTLIIWGDRDSVTPLKSERQSTWRFRDQNSS